MHLIRSMDKKMYSAIFYPKSPLHAKSLQSCLTLCDPMDCIVHGILQARILEWVSPVSPSLGYLPNPWIEPRVSPALWANSLPAEPQGKPNYEET